MRHSRRADKDGEHWPQRDVRTWDPPLSKMGHALADSQSAKIANIMQNVELIVSSPYLRCLQTAHKVRLAISAKSKCLCVDLALSELYDYWNSIRYVDSPDITKDGKYQNMSQWFYKFKRQTKTESAEINRLCAGETSIDEQLKKYVSDEYDKVRICGEFPSFERYLTLPIINQRYCKCFEETVSRTDGNIIIITHMAGVTSIINQLFGRIKYYIKPCDYFVIERQRDSAAEEWKKWKLMYY